MAKHAHTTPERRDATITGAEPPPPRTEARPRGANPAEASCLPLTLIDLDTHPDAALLRACSQATKLRDQLETGAVPCGATPRAQGDLYRLMAFIAKSEAATHIGALMKAIFVMGDRPDPLEHTPAQLYASVIRDFLRVGVPT